MLEFIVLTRINSRESGFYAKELLDDLAKTEFATPEGTLYPLLSKLRREKTLQQSYEESDTGTPRKYYYLTSKGKQLLKGYKIYWRILNRAIWNVAKKPE